MFWLKWIRMTGYLGSGQFGTVNKGVWQSPSGPIHVAIKTLNGNTGENDKIKFFSGGSQHGTVPSSKHCSASYMELFS